MKNQSIMALGVLLAGTHAAEAVREKTTAEVDGITFTIARYDDGRGKPYRLVFKTDGVRSLFMFDTSGDVTNIKVGTERYKVRYDSSGVLKSVKLTSSRRRGLSEEEEEEVEGGDNEGAISERRRLFSCADCEETWDALCDEGLPSVCELVDYGAPILSAAALSIATVCDSFGRVCSIYEGSEACAEQCEVEGTNACLDSTSDGYKCALTGSFGDLVLDGCDLVDADVTDLSLCFDSLGRENIGLVNLDNNQLTTLPGDLLSGMTELGSFFMRGNQVVSVAKEAFSTQNVQLDQLWLSDNALTTLPADLLTGLRGVFSLGLEGNPDLQCVPPAGQAIYEVYVDMDDMLTGTCECEPVEAVLCEEESSCQAGTEGYTCE